MLTNMKINALVIDDSRVMRNMVMQALQKARLANFTFVEAGDGAEALTKLDPTSVDICFVDWNMPNMTGIEFVRHARKQPNVRNIPMIMVTSEQSVAKIDEALTSGGADTYICKPFTAEDMQLKLQKIFRKMEMDRQPKPVAKQGFFSNLFN